MNPYMPFMNPFPSPMQNQQSYQHSSYEAMPPQFRGYPEGYHPIYHPPCASSGMNGFVYPSQYYGCCNHNVFPSYCPPPPPPPPPSMPYGHYHHHPTHCCGGYLVPPGAHHPCQFSPMFPTMGPMQFEYQKDSPNSPNNMWKGDNCLKIEGPRTEPIGDSSVVSSDFKNSPHPFVLVPPNYIKDSSGGKGTESNGDEKLKHAEHQPSFLNRWLPVDIDKWKSSEQMEDDSGRKIHKDNERPCFPQPFFYVPYKANDTGTKNVGQQCPKEVFVEQMDDHTLSPVHRESSKNKSNDRTIVCQDPRTMEPKKVDDLPSEKNVDVDDEAKKSSGDGKRKMSSPAKSSKLPPVCLRVDPLPKKKKGCSPSKSSSPPDEKDKSGNSFKADTKSKVSVSPEERTTSSEQRKRKVKTIKVFDASSQPREDVLVSNINSRNADEDISADQPNHTQSEKNEDKDASKETLPAGKLHDDSTKRELSKDEAAKIIQSAFRGYEDRKWEPLKKLKNIKAVHDEFTQLKKQIDALECTQDNTLLDKSRTVIGESIMNLLLKLDAIQGLPPNVRQVRKSLARDLMSLQDQLDALGHKQTEKTIPSALLAKSEEEVQSADRACIQDDQEENHLLIESGNEIEEKDKSKKHEESPFRNISKENVPDEVECHTTKLNDESLQDVSSNADNLESESMPQNVHDAQSSGVDQSGKEDCEEVRLVEDKLDCVQNMDPAELQDQVPLEPRENEHSDNYGLPEQTPSISKMSDLMKVGDENRQETVDDAPGDDSSGLNEASVNAEPVSEDPVLEPVQVCEEVQDMSLTSYSDSYSLPEQTPSISRMSNLINVGDENRQETIDEAPGDDTSGLNEASVNPEPVSKNHVTGPELICEEVQDLSLTSNNEKADDPVLESVAQSTNVMENRGRLQDQNESNELEDTRVPCEEPVIVVDEDYKVPADITTLPQEQKLADGSLEMFGHPSELAQESEEPNLTKETDEGKFMQISSSQSGFTVTDRSLVEENEKLKEQLQKFIEAGQEQLSAISSLSRKVKDLERKLHRKKKIKMRRSRAAGPKMSMDDELTFALAN